MKKRQQLTECSSNDIQKLQKLVESQANPQQSQQLSKLRGKTFWHWDRGEHIQKDKRTPVTAALIT